MNHDRRLTSAIEELQSIVAGAYPNAEFQTYHRDDPDSTFLQITVDVSDMNDVFDLFADRLLEMQVDEELALYPVIVRPISRTLEMLRHPERGVALLASD